MKGGIVALGLFKKRWSVKKCLDRFCELVDSAFEPRWQTNNRFLNFVYKHAAQLLSSYKYTSEGVDGALKKVFGSGPDTTLFGTRSGSQDSVKVGVVTMSGNALNRAYLLSNYTREWSQKTMAGQCAQTSKAVKPAK